MGHGRQLEDHGDAGPDLGRWVLGGCGYKVSPGEGGLVSGPVFICLGCRTPSCLTAAGMVAPSCHLVSGYLGE